MVRKIRIAPFEVNIRAIGIFYISTDPEEDGQAALDVILATAVKECSIVNDNNPILCLNLIYVYVLLHDGYELQPERKINVNTCDFNLKFEQYINQYDILCFQQIHEKLHGHYISWALGFAYDQLIGIKRTKQ